ncbi:hypothetical protein N657DRAFT_665233 [Parathielavia appendiculata]|uniref:Zn(2)-C6 fungal-type domain-containing protein n=1 Tax=Parathielavia appendiculata TaxID=2587402 RepID=A0AAN6TWE2_9PEZI|nr:hypothetical protein N657DRAFT_665233 [Parathielavia appendiculata]
MGPEHRSERVEQRRRRKIPLACEPCRERKSRCDGAKPICSTCKRRSLPLRHCIYTIENARTASNEAYIKILHDRIQRLEKTCTDNGIRSSPGLRPAVTVLSPDHERLDATESTVSITAMGTVSTEHDVCQAFDAANEFYGSSSAASFMKEAYTSVKPREQAHSTHESIVPRAESVNFARAETFGGSLFAQADKFALPPRNLADHLLSCFWERVFWLYPLFHKPTFIRAYESLWRPAHEQPAGRTLPGLGLGSSPGADAGTIVFHSALNTIFALGAQFADLNPKDKASAIETFFNRAKAFIGLDFIDMNSVGVVQSLLLMALLLQSTPFPSRCWNAVGLACRVAQGLGLHTESDRTSRPQLEVEIRRRTWHGCVILDMIVSMTYGRPTMTAHVPDLPLPATDEFDDESGHARGPGHDSSSTMCFYVEFIRQCRILGDILINVYQSTACGPPFLGDEHKSHGMDAILELDAQLSRYEADLPPIMSWTSPCDISSLDEERRLILTTQRTVLQGSFLYLRLMLHRPILTQLCANATSSPSTVPTSPARPRPLPVGQELFASFAAGCVRICLGAAMDLIELVHDTYLTNTTGGWWWDGLYAFTAGLVVIVSYLSPHTLLSLDRQRVERSWMLCQTILAHLASFSISAQRSLKLLQKVHGDVMSRCLDKDQEAQLRPPTMFNAAAPGETARLGQDAAIMYPEEVVPLGLGNTFQWQLPAGSGPDSFGAGMAFNWDQSLDLITDGLGMGIYQ